MSYVIYALAALSILLAIGGLSAYAASRKIGLLASSVVSFVCAILAIVLAHWWPLLIGFAANWGLKLLGLDPGSRK